MKANKLIQRSLLLTVLFLFSLIMVNCEDFLEPGTPSGQIGQDEVFNEPNTATAAVTSLYGKLRDESFLTGNLSGATITMGLYADELDYYFFPGFSIEAFYYHQVIPSNGSVKSIWDEAYNIVFAANTSLEGIAASNALEPELKNQLRGEALFVRALCHFYLTNFYGEIPYVISTDYKVNSKVGKLPKSQVYDAIVTDLMEAKSLLGNEYLTPDRVRPNAIVVSALLAKIYLYQGAWILAENQSSQVLENPSLQFESDINGVFLLESPSTIWQLASQNEGDNTLEASNLIFDAGPPPLVALNPELVNAFEAGDLRRNAWVGEVTDGVDTWYFANKYKQQYNTGVSLEFSKIFRLAEQYLIRAEARAMLGNISGAQADINIVRNRAGLADTSANTAEELKAAILQERRVELFSELGNRWFDLARTGTAADVLSSIKSGWRATDLLLPIPEAELLANPNLNPQNPGY